MGVLAAVVLAAIWKFGIPWIELTLNTVSTDDAYVNGHVTFVAARVSGQIIQVLVDDNNRVRKGDVVAQLDREPYEIAVAEKRAAVETAKADLLAATAAVRGLEAQARGQYWQLQNAMEDVDNRVALLHARVAALDKSNATFNLAQLEFARAEQLLLSQTISREEYDRRQAVLSESQAEVTQAMADVDQIRVSLGLPAKPDSGELGEVPPDLDQTFSSVRDVQAALIRTAAQLGVGHSYEQLPKQMLQQFENLNRGDVDRTLAELTANAPAVKQAQAKLDAANRDLDQAKLNLRYCDIVAEIDGVVTRRNVNPGNNVQVGQSLMAIRSLREIWVEPISRRRNCVICASASLSICMSTCTEIDTYSRAGSPDLRRGPDRRWRCCRLRMPPATSSKWCSGYRSESTSKDTTQTRIPYSTAHPLCLTST